MPPVANRRILFRRETSSERSLNKVARSDRPSSFIRALKHNNNITAMLEFESVAIIANKIV